VIGGRWAGWEDRREEISKVQEKVAPTKKSALLRSSIHPVGRVPLSAGVGKRRGGDSEGEEKACFNGKFIQGNLLGKKMGCLRCGGVYMCEG